MKHQNKTNSIAFIPALHFDECGISSCSIQVITPENSFSVDFPKEEFIVSNSHFFVKIGNNVFSKDGISIDLNTKDTRINGNLIYKNITPIHSDIMGPFRFLPFMECNHGIVSMSHNLSGSLSVNDIHLDFNGGIGYIETDWGSSFPENYLWTQCNWKAPMDCSIMLSIAKIPFAATAFTGCICSIYYNNKEYRLATYKGSRVLEYSEDSAIVKQGKYTLLITSLDKKPCRLKAPSHGAMSRTVHESLTGKVRYRFIENDTTVFDFTTTNGSFETFGL